MSTWEPAALEALTEEATVDAYGQDEQLTGFFTMIEESLAMPFTTTVLGAEVSVVGVDLAEDGRVVARCARGPVRQDIGILDLPLPEPAPEGSQWIEAYSYWAR
ncbi:calcium-binding protein [Streptomyces bluensis]|uniref:calcium-binding protein n=1 Tax=Streptomyces bluensis TaxID=33897 RepID=UPI0033329E70